MNDNMDSRKPMTVQVIFGEDISLSETDRDVYAADSVYQTRFILSQEITAIFTTTAKADRIEKVIDILGYIKKDLACIEANIQEANYQEYDGIGIDYEKAKLMKRFLVKIDPYFTEGVDWGDELNKKIHYLEDFTNEDVWRLKAMIDLGTEDIQPEPREKEKRHMTDEEKEKYQKLFDKARELFRNPPKTHSAAYYVGLIMERRAREGKDPYGWREDWEKTLKEFHVNEKEK